MKKFQMYVKNDENVDLLIIGEKEEIKSVFKCMYRRSGDSRYMGWLTPAFMGLPILKQDYYGIRIYEVDNNPCLFFEIASPKTITAWMSNKDITLKEVKSF